MKAGVLDSEGKLLRYGRHFFSRNPIEPFYPEVWLNAFKSLCQELDYPSVDAVSISSNGPTLAPVDLEGTAQAPVLFWQDSHFLPLKVSSYYLPKVAWFKENYPQAYEKTDLFLSPSEYLIFKLTGQSWMATSDERFTSYLWTDSQLDVAGLAKEKFPEIASIGTFAGTVNPAGAKDFHLTSGVSCYLMGSDFQASLLGTASVIPGRVCDRAGTSEGLNYCSSHLPVNRELRNLPHVVDGLWNSSAILSSTGALFEWFRELTGQGHRDYQEMLVEIAKVESVDDSLYFFPTLKHGGLWEFSGGMLMGLDPFHGRDALGKAMLESIGFSVRRGLELLKENAGPLERVVLCGGQARSDTWNQLKADYTGHKLILPEVVDAELVGCACAAAVGLGQYKDLKTASLALFREKEEIYPSEGSQDWALKRYELYKKLSLRVKSFYRKKLRIELDKR